MTHLVHATYDGSSLQLDEPLPLEPNTRVRVSVETSGTEKSSDLPSTGVSAFDIALSMNLDGPPDWSERIDHYLYGVDDGK
jgi:hypothetical protein